MSPTTPTISKNGRDPPSDTRRPTAGVSANSSLAAVRLMIATGVAPESMRSAVANPRPASTGIPIAAK
jgi:hypothetical protein